MTRILVMLLCCMFTSVNALALPEETDSQTSPSQNVPVRKNKSSIQKSNTTNKSKSTNKNEIKLTDAIPVDKTKIDFVAKPTDKFKTNNIKHKKNKSVRTSEVYPEIIITENSIFINSPRLKAPVKKFPPFNLNIFSKKFIEADSRATLIPRTNSIQQYPAPITIKAKLLAANVLDDSKYFSKKYIHEKSLTTQTHLAKLISHSHSRIENIKDLEQIIALNKSEKSRSTINKNITYPKLTSDISSKIFATTNIHPISIPKDILTKPDITAVSKTTTHEQTKPLLASNEFKKLRNTLKKNTTAPALNTAFNMLATAKVHSTYIPKKLFASIKNEEIEKIQDNKPIISSNEFKKLRIALNKNSSTADAALKMFAAVETHSTLVPKKIYHQLTLEVAENAKNNDTRIDKTVAELHKKSFFMGSVLAKKLALAEARATLIPQIIDQPKLLSPVLPTINNNVADKQPEPTPKEEKIIADNSQDKPVKAEVKVVADNSQSKPAKVEVIAKVKSTAPDKPLIIHPVMSLLTPSQAQVELMQYINHAVAPMTKFSAKEYAIKIAALEKPVIPLKIADLEKIIGIKGDFNAQDKTYKISVPRDDLKLSANGASLSTEMGLASWVNFKPTEDGASLSGDLVLTADQINPLLSVALDNNVQVTSLISHSVWENPQVVYMHIEAIGKQGQLAEISAKLFAAIKDTSNGKGGDLPFVNIDASDTTLDPHKLDVALGIKGDLKDGVYKIIVNNNNPDANSDSNTWATFIGSDDAAVANGDIIVKKEQLQTVLAALHNSGFYIEQIQPQASDPESQSVFVHYLGIGKSNELANGLHTAIQLINPVPNTQIDVADSKKNSKKKMPDDEEDEDDTDAS